MKRVSSQFVDSTNGVADSFQNMHKVKSKKNASVCITRMRYSRFQFASRGKQFKEFYIKRIVVSRDDLNK